MKRVLTVLVLAPVAVWAVLWSPWWAFLAGLIVVGVLAHREFGLIVEAHRIPHPGWLAAGLGVLWLVAPESLALTTLVLAGMVLMTWALRVLDLASAVTSAATGMLGIVYVFGAWRCAVALREVNPHWLMIALLVCWFGDTTALYVGKAFGKHKMASRVSPSKTWEGAAGSIAGAVLAAGIYAHYLIPSAAFWAVLLIAAFGNVAGQVGDLAESAFKRGSGLKDSGSSLPGHGGWLDRIDASLFSIPATYAVFAVLKIL